MWVSGQRHAPTALPLEKRPGTHFIGGCVVPRAGLDGCGKSRPHRDSITKPSSPQRVVVPTELSQPTKYVKLKAKLYIWRPCCGSRAPFILKFGTWQKWMVSLNLRPLNSRSGPQILYWRCAEQKDLMPLSVIKLRFRAPWTCSLVATPTDPAIK